MSFGGVLAIVFIVLKLIGIITWSWIWVVSPLWIGLIIDIIMIIIYIAVIANTEKHIHNFNRRKR